jgi:hypothetical protein
MWNSLNNTNRNVDTLSKFKSELKKIDETENHAVPKHYLYLVSILDNPKRNVLNFQGQHHIDKMGQIQFLLEINHNLKTMLNFLAGFK